MAKRLRVLVVDDHVAWRGVLGTSLGQHPELSIVGEAADGLEALRKVGALLPDLILLDISLPELNGLEVLARVRDLSPNSKVLIVSETRSAEVAEEAFRRGALGYVVKSGAAMELLPAIGAVLQGRQFVSTHLNGRVFPDRGKQDAPAGTRGEKAPIPLPARNAEKRPRHEVAFYPEDAAYVAGVTRYVETALTRGDPVILIATASHRASILQKLKSDGVDTDALVARRRLVLRDPLETLTSVMADNMPDADRCEQAIGTLITAVDGKSTTHPRVAIYGECSPVLLSQGNTEGAIQLEHLWDEHMLAWGAETLCGYISSELPKKNRPEIVARICAEHTRVHGLHWSQ